MITGVKFSSIIFLSQGQRRTCCQYLRCQLIKECWAKPCQWWTCWDEPVGSTLTFLPLTWLLMLEMFPILRWS